MQIESLEDDKRELEHQVTDIDIVRKTLRAENEALGDARDNAKNMCVALEKDKRQADMLLSEARSLIGNLESQLHEVEQNYMNLQGE